MYEQNGKVYKRSGCDPAKINSERSFYESRIGDRVKSAELYIDNKQKDKQTQYHRQADDDLILMPEVDPPAVQGAAHYIK